MALDNRGPGGRRASDRGDEQRPFDHRQGGSPPDLRSHVPRRIRQPRQPRGNADPFRAGHADRPRARSFLADRPVQHRRSGADRDGGALRHARQLFSGRLALPHHPGSRLRGRVYRRSPLGPRPRRTQDLAAGQRNPLHPRIQLPGCPVPSISPDRSTARPPGQHRAVRSPARGGLAARVAVRHAHARGSPPGPCWPGRPWRPCSEAHWGIVFDFSEPVRAWLGRRESTGVP